MKPLWILDRYLLERSTPETGPGFPDALIAAGCEISVHSFDPRRRELDTPLPGMSDRPCLAYGSYAFVRHVTDAPSISGQVRPGSYARIDNLSFHAFAAHIGDLLLNDDFHILPFAEVARRRPPAHPVFLRPDRVTKAFTGFAVGPGDFAFEVGCLGRTGRVSAEELVVVATAKAIQLECRYVIADGRVVAGSTYGWSEGFRPNSATDPRCDEVAREVAARDWQADAVYTCDVALADGQARVVELNSFSCAGLYACDTVAVAEAVTRAMTDEYGLA